MKQITIPYGNWGLNTITFDVLDEYLGYSLCIIDGEYQCVSSKGLILLRNRLNEHLPDISPDTWKTWVDWVWSLNSGTCNVLSGRPDFTGSAPFRTVGECR